MTETRTVEILRRLESDTATDGELLKQFLRHDEAAFARILRRHGPAVLDVCRRLTRQEQDAEDAFQAVFLLLAQKALAIRSPHSLKYWLYGAAVRVSRRARRSVIRRRAHEVQVVDLPESLEWPQERSPDLVQVLHEELAELPSMYREAIATCDLHGLSRSDAARALGIPEGTLSSRLAGGRKKLAARLARRGVVLSAAAIPTALSREFAFATLPDSLEAKTCALVAGWRTGAALPIAVLRLTHGGFVMRRMLLLGMTCLALTTAGVIYAAQQADPPAQEAVPPKADHAAKAEEPRPAAGEPKKEEKAALLGAPELRRAFDVDLKDIEGAFWSPDGSQLAVTGNLDKQAGVEVFSMNEGGKPEPQHRSFALEPRERLVGFTPNNKRVITELREYELVSGFHKLTAWEPSTDDLVFLKPVGSVNLQPERTHGYAFALDGKTYHTVLSEERTIRKKIEPAPGPLPAEYERVVIAKLTVREVNADTGKSIRTRLSVQGEFDSFQLSRDGNWLAVGQADGVTLHDISSGKKTFTPLKSKAKDKRNPPRPATDDEFARPAPVANSDFPEEVFVEVAPNGSTILATRTSEGPIMIDGKTGKVLPPLEDTEFVVVFQERGAFSSDGRLIAAVGGYRSRQNSGPFLKVWDTRTGKLLKSWSTKGVTVAFHPTKPILAILEPNEKKTRLGVWDFTADVAEEK